MQAIQRALAAVACCSLGACGSGTTGARQSDDPVRDAGAGRTGAGGSSNSDGAGGRSMAGTGGTAGGPGGRTGSASGGSSGGDAGSPADASPTFYLRDLPEVIPTDASVDANGNAYLIGIASRPHVNLGTTTVDLAATSIALVWSLDPAGTVRWASPVNLPAAPAPAWQRPQAGIVVTPSGKSSIVVWGPEHFYIGRLEANGTLDYLRAFDGDAGFVHPAATEDAVYLAGGYSPGMNFGCGPLSGSAGMVLVKLASSDGSCTRSDGYGALAPSPDGVAMATDGPLFLGHYLDQATVGGKTVTTNSGTESVIGSFSDTWAARWLTAVNAQVTSVSSDQSDVIAAGTVNTYQSWAALGLQFPGANADTGFLARFGADGALKSAGIVPGTQHGGGTFSGFSGAVGYLLFAYQGPGAGVTNASYRIARVDPSFAAHGSRDMTYTDTVYPRAVAVGKAGAALVIGGFTGNVQVENLTLTNRTEAQGATGHGFVLSLPAQ